MNLSKNKHLKRINLFDYPKVDTLDISLCESLETLYCTSSVLNYLKTGNQKKLKNMTVQSQTLSTIDLSGLVNLDTLDCQSCCLTELNLEHNPVLSYLNCSYNRLSSLDLRKNHHLKTLIASKQAGKFTLCESGRTGCLTKLILPDNTTSRTGIIQLICDDNKLEYIDFSKSPYLENINCTFNRLKELNTHHNPSLKELICSFNYIALLDLTNNPLLQKIDCSSQGYEWIQQKNKDYRLLKKLLLFHDINGENKQLKELIYSHTGLIHPIKFEQYPNLYHLDCYDNQIRSLNLQHNKELKTLCCSHNKIRTINIYHNKKLENLYCSYNKIRSLNLKNNPNLKKLDIRELPIHKLDLSENPLINEISCNDFPLREHQEKKESRKKLTIRFNETMSAMTIYSIIQHISRKLDIRRGEGKLSLTL